MGRILEDISKWPVEKRAEKIKEIYKNKMGRTLDLDNPKYFTEKIQWIKLYHHDPVMTKCVDKRTFKEYVKEKIGEGYTANIYFSWDSPDEVDLSKIPNQCVIKSNCSGDGNYIVIVRDKSKMDLEKLEAEIKDGWFDRKYLHTNSFANAYYDVEPCVIVEEYISEISEGADDYKFFCFHGEPKFVYVATDHFKNSRAIHEYPVSFYNTDWEYMNVTYGNHTSVNGINKPWHMDEMLEISKKMSKDFPFVRVDFFDTSKKLYLAELTFTPGAGLTPYHPDSFDLEMGTWLDIKSRGN